MKDPLKAIAAMWRGVARVAVPVLLMLLPLAGSATSMGTISVRLDEGQPLLGFSNIAGQAFVIQTSPDPQNSAWQTRATLTGDAAELTWADDSASDAAMFYRVGLATNPTPFLTLQSALHRACTNQGITGASAAAWMPNRGLWIGTFGTSDGSAPIRPHTPFEVGSVTKTMVAATVLRLVEEGRLSLEDTIGKWLPTLVHANISSNLTVRQLLNHRAGTYNFGDDTPFRVQLFADWSRRWEAEDVFEFVEAPYFPANTKGQYSNTGYVLLGLIIRSATGATVASEMRRTVLDRADMRSTWMGAEEPWKRELAHPHLDFNGDGIHEDWGHLSQTAILTSFWTSGAEISTATDLVKFSAALFEGGLLNPASLNSMRQFQSVDAGVYVDYGLGLMRYDILGRVHWCHSGGLFGEFAWMSYCPSTRVSLGMAYNYPVTKAGANLPGELLIALSNMAGSVNSTLSVPRTGPDATNTTRIAFLNAEVPAEGSQEP